MKHPRFYRHRAKEWLAALQSSLRFVGWSFGLLPRPAEDPECSVVFWDGQPRTSSCHVRRLMNFWGQWPQHRKESDACFQAYPGGDVIDVGSHDGWYACLLAPKLSGTMALIEPDGGHFPRLFTILASLQRTFPEKCFLLVPRACSDAPTLNLQRSGEQLLPAADSDNPKSYPAVSLDEISETLRLSPAFVKIDVEGHELAVLQSGQRILTRHRPVLMVEMHGPEIRSQTSAWLAGFSYHEQVIYTEDGITRAIFRPG